MRKALISRFGAFGDHLHCSHIPRLLKEKEGFDYVAFQYNEKGFQIHCQNPFIDEHIHFDPSHYPICSLPASFVYKRLDYLAEEGGFEKVLDLQNSLESGLIAMEGENAYYRDSAYRREKFGKLNFYDQSTIWAGYPQHVGMKGEIHFTPEEVKAVEQIFIEQYAGNFVFIINLSGSSKQKLFWDAEGIVKEFLDRHKEAVCITVGDEDCREHLEFKGERIVNRAGGFNDNSQYHYVMDTGKESQRKGYPFRQAMLMTQYAHMTIGYESGIMIASSILGTPTIQLMTTSSIKNHGGDFPNDYSLQSPQRCSPCHKGPYQFVGCPTFEHLGERYPQCVKFDKDVVLNRMEEVYQSYQTDREFEETLCAN